VKLSSKIRPSPKNEAETPHFNYDFGDKYKLEKRKARLTEFKL
jgi:hypothetical protein